MPELRTFSNDLKNEAYRLGNKSKALFKEAEYTMRSHDNKESAGRELLDTALEQQEDIEDLRNDVDFCDAQADQAIKLWNEILTRAEGNFQLLSGMILSVWYEDF